MLTNAATNGLRFLADEAQKNVHGHRLVAFAGHPPAGPLTS